MSLEVFSVVSACATAFVPGFLLWVLVARPASILRPSLIFAGAFWVQVQLASTINAGVIYARMDNAFAYLALIQLFPVAICVGTLFILPRAAEAAAPHVRIQHFDPALLSRSARCAVICLALIYAVVALYLTEVPLNETGLYALIFDPAHLDQYREASMKLLDKSIVTYSFAIMEKVMAPLAAAFSGLLLVGAFKGRRPLYGLAAVIFLVLAAVPTMLYGARGPMTLVMAAFAATIVFLHVDRVRLYLAIPLVALCIVPVSVAMSMRSGEINVQTIGYSLVNIADRVMGRNYIDNVWHIEYVHRRGLHGVGGIEKLAPFFGVEPVDVLGVVGQAYAGQASSTGLAFLDIGEAPVAAPAADSVVGTPVTAPEVPANVIEVDLDQTASSGAAFQTLNFAMFGWWSLPFSFAFIFVLDLVLYAYRAMPRGTAGAVAGALVVPVIALCFSLATTVLATKGFVLTIIVGWLIGAAASWLLREPTLRRSKAHP